MQQDSVLSSNLCTQYIFYENLSYGLSWGIWNFGDGGAFIGKSHEEGEW